MTQERAVHPMHYAIDALDALEGRAPIEYLRDYLDMAASDLREKIMDFPNNRKVEILALCGVIDRMATMLDEESGSARKIALGYRRKARPKTSSSTAADAEAKRKRRGLFLYEQLISEGLPHGKALEDAASAAGTVPRNFDRILEARRCLDDPERLEEYALRGLEQWHLAKWAADARQRYAGIAAPEMFASRSRAIGARWMTGGKD